MSACPSTCAWPGRWRRARDPVATQGAPLPVPGVLHIAGPPSCPSDPGAGPNRRRGVLVAALRQALAHCPRVARAAPVELKPVADSARRRLEDRPSRCVASLGSSRRLYASPSEVHGPVTPWRPMLCKMAEPHDAPVIGGFLPEENPWQGAEPRRSMLGRHRAAGNLPQVARAKVPPLMWLTLAG